MLRPTGISRPSRFRSRALSLRPSNRHLDLFTATDLASETKLSDDIGAVLDAMKRTDADRASLGSFYTDLERLLKQQIKDQPAGDGIRLKLLELYYETGKPKEFLQEAELLRERISRPKQSQEWQKVLSMGRMLLPKEKLFAESSGGGDKIAFIDPNTPAESEKKVHRRIGDDAWRQKFFETLATEYGKVRADPKFLGEFDLELAHIAGRPTSLSHARQLSKKVGGAQIYLKREDLAPAGTHLAIAIVGQALLAKRLGKKVLVTASGNGHKGVVTASIAARLGMKTVVYMDGEAMQRQSGNVFRMWVMGAAVHAADPQRYPSGDVRQAALDHWTRQADDSFLVMGLDAAPHPYPMMAREFAAVIGRETRRQVMIQAKRQPDVLVARAGNNADAIGFFQPFLAEGSTHLFCVETAAEIGKKNTRGAEDPYDPTRIPLSMQQTAVAGAILEGLEYPSVSREHAWLRASGRVGYVAVTPSAVKAAISDLASCEGIIPAIGTAHVVASACETAARMPTGQAVVAIIAEAVDKDIWEIGKTLGVPL